MYQYNGFDTAFLKERNLQFRDQVRRRISGALSGVGLLLLCVRLLLLYFGLILLPIKPAEAG